MMWAYLSALLSVPDWWSSIPGALEFVILLSAAVGAVVALKKYVYNPIKRFNNKIERGMDSLLGYPAVTDPATGREIQAATPPLANRVYDLEQTSHQVADALTSLAQNQTDILALQAKWEERERIGNEIIEDFTKWRQSVDDRLRDWVSEQDQLAELIRKHHPEVE